MVCYPCYYSHLRVFGCPAYFHVNDGKLEFKTKKAIFFAYAIGVKGYRCGVLILSHLNLLLVGMLLLMKILYFNMEKSLLFILQVQRGRKQAMKLENNASGGVQEITHVEPVDDAQVQLLVMIHLKSNNTIMSLRE